MSSTGAHDAVERVRLNLRVSKSVKEAYEGVVADKFGKKRPYTGTELERELRFALDDGTVADLFDAVSDLADAFGEAPREKKNLSRPGDDTVVVAYRIAEPIRAGIMSLASGEGCSNPGEFVERIMHSYACGEGVDERLIDLTDRIKQAADHKFDDELSATERRTKAIAAELDTWSQFTIDEFDEAIESVPKISPTNYTREQYLPRVLDELDATWHPQNPAVFVDCDEDYVPPEVDRDHRNKPYLLMDESDKRLAIKTDLVCSSGGTVYTAADAADALQNKPQKGTIKDLMRQIGKTDGFRYRKASQRRGNKDDDVLRMNREAVLDSTEHIDLQQFLSDEQADAVDDNNGTTDIDTDGTQWVQEAAECLPDAPAETLPDAVFKNKIARATTDESQRDETGSPTDAQLDAVTDEQVAQVREYVEDSTDETGNAPSEGRGSTDETTTQQPDMTADEPVDALAEATPVRTDGGGIER